LVKVSARSSKNSRARTEKGGGIRVPKKPPGPVPPPPPGARGQGFAPGFSDGGGGETQRWGRAFWEVAEFQFQPGFPPATESAGRRIGGRPELDPSGSEQARQGGTAAGEILVGANPPAQLLLNSLRSARLRGFGGGADRKQTRADHEAPRGPGPPRLGFGREVPWAAAGAQPAESGSRERRFAARPGFSGGRAADAQGAPRKKKKKRWGDRAGGQVQRRSGPTIVETDVGRTEGGMRRWNFRARGGNRGARPGLSEAASGPERLP